MAGPDTEQRESVTKPATPAKPAPSPKKARPKRAAETPRNAPAPRKKATPAARHPGHGWLWTALVALAILNGGAIATVWLMDAATERAETKRIETQLRAELSTAAADAANQKLAALESHLADVEGQIAEIPDRASAKETEAATALLAEKVDGLTERIGNLEKSWSSAQSSGAQTDAIAATSEETKRNAADLAAIKERLASLESAQKAQAPAELERTQTLVVAVGQLREALDDSEPFNEELDAVVKLGGDPVKEMTADIAPFAATGIPTASQLRQQFQGVADKIVQADAGPEKGDWINKALAQAASVVTVRKVGPAEGDTPGAIVSRAEEQLKLGDLKGAVDELSALTGAPAAAAAEWMTQARARLAGEQALRDLHNHVIGQIAETPGPAQ